ncbi:MAG: hypothetical protein JEY96_08760 [Bacteroidales bacterium]|nr:hypothetical protein [Bacteroidales bacterium]
MKKIKYIIVFLLSIGLLNSCLIDNDTDLDKNDAGSNFVSFESNIGTLAAIADGAEYEFYLKLELTGPTSKNVTQDLTVTIVADDASTAVEGVHYRIDNPTITLEAVNNYLAKVNVTMLTDGIVTPLDASPILILKLTNATGNATVIPNGKVATLNMNYACPSFLEGTYDVVHTREDGAASAFSGEKVTNIGIGEYITKTVGIWSPPLQPQGMRFFDICNVITVPLQDLYQWYPNENYSHEAGFVDESTGVITIYYTIGFTAGDKTFTAVYTPVK